MSHPSAEQPDTFPPAHSRSTSGRSSLDELREALTASPVSPETMHAAQEAHQRGMWLPTWVIVGTWIGLSTGVILYK